VMRIRAATAKWESEKGWTFYNGKFLGFYSAKGLPVIDENKSSLVWETKEAESIKDEVYQTKSPGISRSFRIFYDDILVLLWRKVLGVFIWRPVIPCL